MCISSNTILRPREEWQPTDKYSTRTRIVPCGKCYKCLGRRRNAWSFRLYHEMLISETASFVTLTYGADEKRGFGEEPPTSFNGIYSLDKKHFQDFIKRLRIQNQKAYTRNGKPGECPPLRYYAVGEYGTNHLRPHYHLILLNLENHLRERSFGVAKDIWKKGNVDIADCNIATINYVVGYLMKGVWQPQTDDDDRLPEFSLMSKKLGSNYLTDEIYHYHLDRMETSVDHPSGFRIPLPRYYRDQIFSVEEKAELYEINQLVQAMSWEEFVNVDYDMERLRIKRGIEKSIRHEKTQRVTL